MTRAMMTSSPELETLRREDQRLVDDLADRRRMQSAHLGRLKELEAVRRQFKRHRYDDLRSVFEDDRLIGQLLSEFLRGAIRGSGLWDAIRRQQRYQDVGERVAGFWQRRDAKTPQVGALALAGRLWRGVSSFLEAVGHGPVHVPGLVPGEVSAPEVVSRNPYTAGLYLLTSSSCCRSLALIEKIHVRSPTRTAHKSRR